MKYYVMPCEGILYGPYSLDEIKEKRRSGWLKDGWLVRPEGSTTWNTIRRLIDAEGGKENPVQQRQLDGGQQIGNKPTSSTKLEDTIIGLLKGAFAFVALLLFIPALIVGPLLMFTSLYGAASAHNSDQRLEGFVIGAALLAFAVYVIKTFKKV